MRRARARDTTPCRYRQKNFAFALPRLALGDAQDCGGINRRDHGSAPGGGLSLATQLGQAKFPAEQSLGRSGVQSDNHARRDDGDFALQPLMTRSDLPRIGLVMNPAPARGSHLKCLTALVIYTSAHGTCAAAKAWSNKSPAGPTKGRPSRSSRSSGISPTSMRTACGGPPLKIV